MRHLEQRGKKIFIADFAGVEKQVRTGWGLYLGRHFAKYLGSTPIEKIAEYRAYKLMKGVDPAKQCEWTDWFVENKLLGKNQAYEILAAGKITDECVQNVLRRLADGGASGQ